MNPFHILNDLHIGAIRSGGTTEESRRQLRRYLLSGFSRCLDEIDTDLVILGDLFDTFYVFNQDYCEPYLLLYKWLVKQKKSLVLVPGNHDISKDRTLMSSFELLGRQLQEMVPYQVKYVEAPKAWNDCYIIPHMVNQEEFDKAIEQVPQCEHLLVHCNYDNNFAVQSDHSLNFSKQQIRTTKAKSVIFAHEHQGRVDGKAYVLGNQFPSSISDCLRNEVKNYHYVGDDIEPQMSWEASDSFAEIAWHELIESQIEADFIRVVGEASAEDLKDVVATISKYRRKSDAFIISNAVKVLDEDGQLQMEGSSIEELKQIDLMHELSDMLSGDQMKVVREVMEDA